MRNLLNASHVAGRLLNAPSMTTRHLVSARDGRWEYMAHRDIRDGTEESYLYDCRADLNEAEDVKEKYPRAVKSLARELEPLLSGDTPERSRRDGVVTSEIASGLTDMGRLKR